MLTPKNPEYYHPIRYQKTRPFARKIAGRFPLRPGLPEIDEFNEIQGALGVLYNKEIMKFPFEERPPTMDRLVEEVNSLGKYIEHARNGKNIFSFSGPLAELLRHTDVGDIVLSNIPFIYNCFYITFGPQKDMEIFPGFCVDGAYIHTLFPGQADIYVTTIATGFDFRAPHVSWLEYPERHFHLAVSTAYKATVKESCDQAFTEQTKALSLNPGISPETLLAAAEQGITLIDGHPKNSAIRKHVFTSGFPVFLRALNLIINGICYLGYHKREVVKRHMESAPPRLIAKISEAEQPKKKRRLTSELEILGYFPIHFCGDSISIDGEAPTATGREVNSHWRRGHWRNQPFGKGLSEHRLRWIRPTIVRLDKGYPEGGRTYIVEEEME